ncbi:hypothetical protein SAMN05444162_3068 [Paenibacillaceae bacterium GAS479]|nr:hypothetical protein SAMN05444162_3068 [Paenibacillaceae bacterium GAS479]
MKLPNLLYLLIAGIQKWNDQKSVLPHELKQGHMELTKTLLKANRDVPADIPSLIKWLQIPVQEWGLEKSSDVPFASPILSRYGVITPDTADFMQIYDNPSEAQSREVYNILQYCRLASPQLDEPYRQIRTFIIQNAVVSAEVLYSFALQFSKELSKYILACYDEEFTSKIEHYRKCPRCGWTLSYRNHQWQCGAHDLCGQIQAKAFQPEQWPEDRRLFRLTEGVHRYTLLPGMTELSLKNKLEQEGFTVELYPDVDRFDLSVKKDGRIITMIDVKDFSHPLNLAYFFNQLKEDQLAKYINEKKLLIVIPDYRKQHHSMYAYQVKQALSDKASLLQIWDEKKAISKLKEYL